MSASVKISIIGAGSAQFSLKMVRDLCLTETLADSQVCFMDLDPERLDLVHTLATRYANEMGSKLRFQTTEDRIECLKDADFVINTAYVKGHAHEWAMRDVAAKHGYYYDGVQPGEFYQLKMVLDLARDMEKICPDAWLLQVGNPVFNCTTLVSRETNIKVCGLCHGHYGTHKIAKAIGIDPDQMTWQATGFNHNIWLSQFMYQGKDAYPLIDTWIENESEAYWRTHEPTSTHDIDMSRAAVHQYRMYGLFPIGDTVRRVGAGPTVGCTGYRGDWWFHTDPETKKFWFGEPWGGPDTLEGRRYFEKMLENGMAKIQATANDPKSSIAEAVGEEKSKEAIIPIIDALVNDREGRFQVNVPNQGALKGIPDNVVVEVLAVVSKKGIQPLHVSALPPRVMLMCILPHWLDMERNLLAFKTGDQSMLLWNTLDSHQTRSYDQAVDVLEALMTLEGHAEMREHYKYLTDLSFGIKK
ncbi:MAG: alpha-glucosidase/alpha-galactosidase [Deltaproteobacteria bacterium]|nr:alpha-glucosidase/alpha-galactosidase [Deltaproteobacteria bacterium]